VAAGLGGLKGNRNMTNKEILMAFYEEVFNGHNADAARKYLREDYIQHNPGVGQGREAFIEAFRKKFEQVPHFHLDVKRIIVEGDMAAVHIHATGLPGKNESVVVDIYRFRDGLLAEHWDCLMPIPQDMLGNDIYF
jgi:predicted SnoaL-like aldol condensation-catalyzing enzyme